MRKPLTARQHANRGGLPDWLARYLATGEKPPRGSADCQAFDDWFLFAGEARSRGWPEPPPPARPHWWPSDA